MKITEKDVEYVAKLSRLHITDEQKEKLTVDMAAIIGFADKLSQIDTGASEPQAHAIVVENVFRSDEIKPSYKRDEILKNAPDKQAGCFAVPRIVE